MSMFSEFGLTFEFSNILQKGLCYSLVFGMAVPPVLLAAAVAWCMMGAMAACDMSLACGGS